MAINDGHSRTIIGGAIYSSKVELKMSGYELQRLKRIAENKRRMEELGIKKLASEVTCLRKDRNQRDINKLISKNVVSKDIPGEKEHGEDKFSKEDDAQQTDEIEPQQFPNNAVGITNESLSMQEQHNLSVKKRTRGPSLCKDIHDRTIDDRSPIILNGLCQPIGPDKATLDKFSRFLGSLARDSNLAPLNEVNWTHVRDKDKIWEYVKTKFVIAEEDTDDELKTIPDSQLKDLQKYWDLEEVQSLWLNVQQQVD
ncbi:regulator of Vps4 activity in the MVB pathway protein, partial [Striga asiatica]